MLLPSLLLLRVTFSEVFPVPAAVPFPDAWTHVEISWCFAGGVQGKGYRRVVLARASRQGRTIGQFLSLLASALSAWRSGTDPGSGGVAFCARDQEPDKGVSKSGKDPPCGRQNRIEEADVPATPAPFSASLGSMRVRGFSLRQVPFCACTSLAAQDRRCESSKKQEWKTPNLWVWSGLSLVSFPGRPYRVPGLVTDSCVKGPSDFLFRSRPSLSHRMSSHSSILLLLFRWALRGPAYVRFAGEARVPGGSLLR